MRIANRSSTGRIEPWGLWLIAIATTVEFEAFGLLFLFAPFPGSVGWAVFYIILGSAYLPVAWMRHISWIEIGPDRIVVRRPIRPLVIPVGDIASVDAHRHWQSPNAKGKAPWYWLVIRRSGGQRMHLEYIEPRAGDRLLYDLYTLRKPIAVYNWQ